MYYPSRNSYEKKEGFRYSDGYLLTLVGENISEILSVPMNIEGIDCSFNYIKSLEVPEGIDYICCHNNPLKSIKLSDSVEMIRCEDTYLSTLELHEGISYLDCRNTNVKKLHLPYSMCEINCDNTVCIENLGDVMEDHDLWVYMRDPEIPYFF